MKKIIIIFLALFLSSCGITKPTVTQQEITFPFSFFEAFYNQAKEQTITFVEETYSKKEGISGFKVLDDRVVITVEKDKIENYQQELKDAINKKIEKIISAPELEISKITYNPTLTEFKVTSSTNEVSFGGVSISFLLYLTGGVYQMFDGVEPENIEVKIQFFTSNGIFLEEMSSKRHH